MLLARSGLSRLWDDDPERGWLVGRRLVPLPMRFLAPGYAYGVDRLPETGGAVIAANHFSGIDPPLMGIHSPRTIYFMAKQELVSMPLIGDILRWVGVFGVRRGESDRDSLRVARWLAHEGHLVGMFMEGTRQRFGYPGPVHPGAVMIALQEGVPLIPCGVDTYRWSPANRRPCAVVWGDPLPLDGVPATGRGYKEGAALVEAEIHRLWRQAAQAVHDGFPETLPDGTRRFGRVKPHDVRTVRDARPWPVESWAAGPLGPVYRARR